MKEALSQYLEREEKAQEFRRKAGKAGEDYKATGLHATDEEVVKWLESWGQENEAPVPKCHK